LLSVPPELLPLFLKLGSSPTIAAITEALATSSNLLSRTYRALFQNTTFVSYIDRLFKLTLFIFLATPKLSTIKDLFSN
jgi:hypothetical protein